jgi:uncharacterized membrane protein YoaK (UPF0700 family)
MTGIVSRAGDELAQRHYWLATRALLFLASFMFGAAAATGLVLQARRRGRPAFWRPLLLEAALLLCFASLGAGTGVGAHLGDFVMTALIYIAIEMTKLVDRWRVASRGHPTSACLAVSSAERQSVPPLT